MRSFAHGEVSGVGGRNSQTEIEVFHFSIHSVFV
jgi:hypothetical protein